MSPFLADMLMHGHEFGIQSEHSQAAEAFVIFTLGCLFGMLLMVGLAAWVLWRRATRPKPHRQLLMELEAELESESPLQITPGKAQPDDKPEPKPWEREADWWRK